MNQTYSDRTSKLRPISPHLSVYQPQVTSVFSIFHRISGVSLASSILFLPIFLSYINLHVSFFQPSLFFQLSLLFPVFYGIYQLLLLLMNYHMLNGLRHLTWDSGNSFELNGIFLSASYVLIFLFIRWAQMIFFPI